MLEKPTRREKVVISNHKLNPDNWLVSRKTAERLYIKHRKTGTNKVLPKPKCVLLFDTDNFS